MQNAEHTIGDSSGVFVGKTWRGGLWPLDCGPAAVFNFA